jgi:pantetheine-phosphate adenylyltransferase
MSHSPSDRASVTAVYPGTFDPVTLGHMDLMVRGARLFDRLILAVAVGHHKRTMFTLDERLEMAAEIARQISPEADPQRAARPARIEVRPFNGLLTQFMAEVGAQVVLRGVRTVTDCDYEFQMAAMNRQLRPTMDTVFLTPSTGLQHVSASFVREIATLGGDVSSLVAPSVLVRVKERVSAVQRA